ncbi:MAG: glycosyltransferase family 4 protein [Flavobacteriaceae bacterium]|jgi:glycosyltransferase involved in cell wall biosynthesis|nr:glycosyltransferase family 4 protein [Flavobacteriaceae bacterium]
MKTLYFIPHLRTGSGMGRVLNVKANYLAEVLGHEVTIITYRQFQDPVYFTYSDKVKMVHLDLDDPSFRLKELSFFEKRKQIQAFMSEYREKVENYLQNNPTDVCISMFLGAEYKFLTEIKDGSKKIIEFHFNFDISPFRIFNQKKSLKNFRNFLQIKSLKKKVDRFDKLVVLTEEDAVVWRKYFQNIHVITNPITINSEHINASLKSKVTLAVGRLTQQKGFDYLIDAWKTVHENQPDWKLQIYGEGELQDALNRQIQKNGLEDVVEIKDPVKNIEQVYEQSSLFVLSSRFEGFVLSLLEAMSCALPVVSFDCKYGPTQLIQYGENGFLVPLGNTKILAEKILEVLKDEDLRNSMGKSAKKTSENYSVPSIMAEWDKLFLSLTQENQP